MKTGIGRENVIQFKVFFLKWGLYINTTWLEKRQDLKISHLSKNVCFVAIGSSYYNLPKNLCYQGWIWGFRSSRGGRGGGVAPLLLGFSPKTHWCRCIVGASWDFLKIPKQASIPAFPSVPRGISPACPSFPSSSSLCCFPAVQRAKEASELLLPAGGGEKGEGLQLSWEKQQHQWGVRGLLPTLPSPPRSKCKNRLTQSRP